MCTAVGAFAFFEFECPRYGASFFTRISCQSHVTSPILNSEASCWNRSLARGGIRTLAAASAGVVEVREHPLTEGGVDWELRALRHLDLPQPRAVRPVQFARRARSRADSDFKSFI